MKLQAKNTLTGATLLSVTLLLGLAGTSGCDDQTVKAAETGTAPQATFANPEQAGHALLAAAQGNNEDALAQILGSDSKAILSSGDATEDKAANAEFVAKYDRMHRWVEMTDGTRVLYIGADNYPYPIPLVMNPSSRWYFNTDAGKDEVLARRIGKNELLAIDALTAMAKAQEVYFKTPHNGDAPKQYAQKILSSPGKRDGLYWEVPADRSSSPLGRLNDFAQDVVTSTQVGEPPIFDGYSFRILAAQGDKAPGGARSYVLSGKMTGGFAILATPAIYGDSGIMTFILARGGRVYQKDLGTNTATLAASIDSYNPDKSWMQAE